MCETHIFTFDARIGSPGPCSSKFCKLLCCGRERTCTIAHTRAREREKYRAHAHASASWR